MKHATLHSDLSVQDRFGLKLVARLSEATDALPHDISERLRVARMHALTQCKLTQIQTASATAMSGGAATLALGPEETSPWRRVAALIPLIVLIAGLVAIHTIQNDNRAKELAEIDSALLTDDLPPAAYTDPGFSQFLRSHRDPSQ